MLPDFTTTSLLRGPASWPWRRGGLIVVDSRESTAIAGVDIGSWHAQPWSEKAASDSEVGCCVV